jgi:hypothetical protein
MSDKLDELEKLTPLIPQAIAARALGNNLDKANDVLSDVNRQTSRFVSIVETALLLKAAETPYALLELDAAFNEAFELGRKLQSVKAAPDVEDVVDIYRDFLKAITSLDKVMRRLWDETAAREFLTLKSIGALLATMPSTKELGSKLLALSNDATSLQASRVSAEEFAPQVLALRQRRTFLQSELNAITEDKEIDIFLKNVTARTATLAHVTPRVIKWLNENGAIDKFAVYGQT